MSVLMLFSAGCNNNPPPVAPAKYTVTFDSNGGSAVAPQEIEKGGKAAKPSDPSKDDNTFAGWYVEESLKTLWDFDAFLVTKAVTLYAKWTPEPDNSTDPDDPYGGNNPYEGMDYGDMIFDKAFIENRLANDRKWVGCPSIERTAGGRLYMLYCSGGSHEPLKGNYIAVVVSDDEGDTWEPLFMFYNEDRMYTGSFVWIDPLGRLWVTFADHSIGYPGGEVMASICEYPDRPVPIFAPPRRIGYGFSLNKPIVTSDGRWLFMMDVAGHISYQEPIQDIFPGGMTYDPWVYESTDEGETLHPLGHTVVPVGKNFSEHMILEKNDGTLNMYIRTTYGVGLSQSTDGGATWTAAADSGIPGPTSRFYIGRLPSGRVLMINHHNTPVRSNMTAMLSDDDGATWPHKLLLDERYTSYPDVTVAGDGSIYVAYDYNRISPEALLLMAKITEEDIIAGRLVNGGSYLKKTLTTTAISSTPFVELSETGDRLELNFESDGIVTASNHAQISTQIVADTSGVGTSFGKALEINFATTGTGDGGVSYNNPFISFENLRLSRNLYYKASFDYKVLQASANPFDVIIREVSGSHRNTGENPVSLAAVSTGVEKFSTRLEVASWDMTYLRFVFSAGNRAINAKILVDNLVIEVVDPLNREGDKINLDFESQGMITVGADAPQMRAQIVDDTSGIGASFGKALEVTFNTTGTGSWPFVTFENLTINTNRNYKLSFDYKVLQASPNAFAPMIREGFGLYRNTGDNKVSLAAVSTDIQKYSVNFAVGAWDKPYVKLQLSAWNRVIDAKVLIDNLELEVIWAPAEPFRFSSIGDKIQTDFEGALPFGFGIPSASGISASVVTDTSGIGASFGKALEISFTNAEQWGRIPLNELLFAYTSSTTRLYRVSFDYKVITPSDAPIAVVLREDGGTYRSDMAPIAVDLSKTGAVQQFSCTLNNAWFTENITDLSFANFNMPAAPLTCKILIDNLVIELIA